jgi:prepilin-type N-terminal cleavage/methylation domain-containing protein
MTNSKRRGFTIVEVIVALGIAATALILLLGSNRDSMQRSQRGSEACTLERHCTNKLAEIRCRIEPADRGTFKDLPEWRWEVRRQAASLGEIENLYRLALQLTNITTGERLERSVLLFDPPKKVQP